MSIGRTPATARRVWGTLDPFLESGAVLGRKMANTSFLAALLRADPFDEYHFFLADAVQRDSLREHLEALFPAQAGRLRVLDRRDLPENLARQPYHCFHQSDCIALQASLARARNAYSPAVVPITGVTHSLSYANYAEAFLRHLWPGTSPRDCIVCTSAAAVGAVQEYFDQLRQGYGLGPEYAQPLLRRIPLGVDPQGPAPATAEQRAAGRQSLGLEPERTVFLVFGRLSHQSKMDLLPLLRAFQHAFQQRTMAPEQVSLVLAGWVEEGDAFPDTLKELAANIGLDLRVEARPGERRKQALYYAADVFVSIADNPQETFGLTVLEAASAGLPAVVSDYDGYRDLVRHGVTGLLVPTLGPEQSTDLDIMAPLLYDNQYHLLLAQRTAVDVPGLACCLARLHADPDQRAHMGRAARTRVLEQFTWDKVVCRYLELWDELWTLPARQAGPDSPCPAHPGQVQYARTFSGYPTRQLHDQDVLALGRTGQATYRHRDAPLIYPGLGRVIRPEAVRRLLFLARRPATVHTLVQGLLAAELCRNAEQARVLLLWAVKHDLLECAPTKD
ncbi:MAG: glycosyltransferase family 4 protein [Desulfovibrio sp.]|jgi:glycosyltransferase involved in cell wall biosynthesis